MDESTLTKSPYDHLNLTGNSQVKKMINKYGHNFPDPETIIYSRNLIKINRKGREQERCLLVTSKAVYNLVPKQYSKCKRRIKLEDIASVTMSTTSDEFAIHIPAEYDYRFKSNDKEKIAELLQNTIKKIADVKGIDQMGIQKVPKDTLFHATVTKEQMRLMTREQRYQRIQELREQASALSPDDFEDEKDGGKALNLLADKQPALKIGPDDFEFLKVIGRGSFGKVMQVRYKSDKKIYAMKILRKKAIVARNQVEHTKSERKILQALQHPFLMTLRFAFQTDAKLYFVLDYVRGGELFYHLKKRRKFTEDEARIFVAEVGLALGHLHSLDIIYRDLKPENILLHASGHIRLTDFGLSKDLDPNRPEAHTFCGTPEYLAPEIIAHKGHSFEVDWWSLGILLYELTGGIPPFYSQNVNEMYQKIQQDKVKFPNTMSEPCRDLITQLLEREPTKRLGSKNDIEDIKPHRFFKRLDWEKLYKMEIDPPYKPKVSGEEDTSNFSKEFTREQAADTYAPPTTLGGEDFKGFTFQTGPKHMGTGAFEE